MTPIRSLPMLSVKQVAARIGVSTKTVRRMIESGVLHHHRVGRIIRVSHDDLCAYINGTRR